ncbi:ribosome biogenesis protein Nop16 [Chaetomium tenue]|uniref:Ribosome biogenesis protein Nop16 n=1 Tax=Chaetomium tenue TaxID=1854479 RepID=A0ACB7PFE9_9PEZI|nr:ribosome biogenesis protein Nop16 [Chaetomium globosum]
MGRELQKRKRRSSRAKVTMPNRRKKALNPLGNDIIAKAWNKKETLSQNYTRFGLVAKLGKATGGAAPSNRSTLSSNTTDPLAAASADRAHGLLRVGEVRVERDADGRITRVLRDENPLGDPLNALDSDEDEDGDDGEEGEGGEAGRQLRREQAQAQARRGGYEEWSGFGDANGNAEGERPEVLRALEREANRPTEKAVRHQSEREVEWLRRLAEKHGDDTAAMARDARLNPMQQTAADIRRRLKKAGLLEA